MSGSHDAHALISEHSSGDWVGSIHAYLDQDGTTFGLAFAPEYSRRATATACVLVASVTQMLATKPRHSRLNRWRLSLASHLLFAAAKRSVEETSE